MGILNGSRIMINFKTGLYKFDPENYNIYVDGELIRYKGMIEENLSKHDAEEAIALASFQYLTRLIKSIELLLKRRANQVTVYLDGSRVTNKVVNRPEFKFDAGLIRRIFAIFCTENNMKIINLNHGESELQMYLKRDKNIDLNVFVTNDSDMLSICYGHTSTIDGVVCENIEKYTIEKIVDNLRCCAIEDDNFRYLPGLHVKDSCLWINCGKKIVAYGFDNTKINISYKPHIFRTFVALCGTDFTPSMLTETLINGVMKACKKDIEYINCLDDINEIAACLLVIGIKGGGTIKRKEDYSKATFNYTEIPTMVNMYIDYISTGRMSEDLIPRPQMSYACRHYLYAMKGQDDNFTKKALYIWSCGVELKYLISAFKKYIGTYICDDDKLSNSKIIKKRKQIVNEDLCSNKQICNNERTVILTTSL